MIAIVSRCPDCGFPLAHQEGCTYCPRCGYTTCNTKGTP